MGKRLTQIATRTGDDGSTGLGDNTRVSKDSVRVRAMGDVDELNSHLGLLLCESLPLGVADMVMEAQHQLFNLGGELSMPGVAILKEESIEVLDRALAQLNGKLPGLEEFILPGGCRSAAQAHVCRTVARRAERSVVSIGEVESIRTVPQRYLNRLSDLMFVLARTCNRMNGGDDVYWKSERMRSSQAESGS